MGDWEVALNGVDVNHCDKSFFDVNQEIREVHEEREEMRGNPS